LTVFAAASLRESFTSIARQYEILHPGTRVLLSFAGSQTLAAQIAQGAPADVFASASLANLKDAAVPEKTIHVFAVNRLVIVARKGYHGLQSVSDLSEVPRIVVAAKQVPAGAYALKFLRNASKSYGMTWLDRTTSHITSYETDVRAVLTKVELGEADAGIVYATDAFAAGDKVQTTMISTSMNVFAQIAAGIPKSAPHPVDAQEFMHFLLTTPSKKILKRYGFMPGLTIRKAKRP
jgi:molybdate transport system substrate-binding protein